LCVVTGGVTVVLSKVFQLYGSAYVADILLWLAVALVFSAGVGLMYLRK